MKKSYKDRISALGLSYQKEVTFLLIINVLVIGMGAGAYFYFQHWLVFAVLGVALIASNFLYLSRYGSLEKQQEKEHVNELISLLSYFEIFISNGNNVYTAFKMLIPYSSTFMEDAINSMLNQIDVDKSVGPFITFASKFNNRIIESLMLSIYQMVDNGENSGQFAEFNTLFANISKDHQMAMIEEKKRKLNGLDTWPLIGSGAITIVLAIAILNIIGDYINVI